MFTALGDVRVAAERNGPRGRNRKRTVTGTRSRGKYEEISLRSLQISREFRFLLRGT